jgi:hypothetical protein
MCDILEIIRCALYIRVSVIYNTHRLISRFFENLKDMNLTFTILQLLRVHIYTILYTYSTMPLCSTRYIVVSLCQRHITQNHAFSSHHSLHSSDIIRPILTLHVPHTAAPCRTCQDYLCGFHSPWPLDANGTSMLASLRWCPMRHEILLGGENLFRKRNSSDTR